MFSVLLHKCPVNGFPVEQGTIGQRFFVEWGTSGQFCLMYLMFGTIHYATLIYNTVYGLKVILQIHYDSKSLRRWLKAPLKARDKVWTSMFASQWLFATSRLACATSAGTPSNIQLNNTQPSLNWKKLGASHWGLVETQESLGVWNPKPSPFHGRKLVNINQSWSLFFSSTNVKHKCFYFSRSRP